MTAGMHQSGRQGFPGNIQIFLNFDAVQVKAKGHGGASLALHGRDQAGVATCHPLQVDGIRSGGPGSFQSGFQDRLLRDAQTGCLI